MRDGHRGDGEGVGGNEDLKELWSLIKFIDKPKIQILYIAPKTSFTKLKECEDKNEGSAQVYWNYYTWRIFDVYLYTIKYFT